MNNNQLLPKFGINNYFKIISYLRKNFKYVNRHPKSSRSDCQ